MRYISANQRLGLLTYGGEIKYQWENGVLVVGDPKLNSLDADKIDETQTSPVKDTELMILYSSASNLARFGLGKLFWEAKPLDPGDDLTVGKYYEVIKGAVVYNGATYKLHEKFYAVTGQTEFTEGNTTGSQLALAVPPEYAPDCECDQDRDEWFKIKNLEHGKEARVYVDFSKEAGYSSHQIGSTLQSLEAPLFTTNLELTNY